MKILLFTLSLTLSLSACAVVPLSAESIDSQVVDADTGSPIEGANVVAYWQIDTGSLTGDSLPCGAAGVEEAVTDKDGKFHLPGWGPTLPGCGGTMSNGEPMIYVFKPGYHYGRYSNGLGSTAITFRTYDYWQHRQMKLQAFANLNLRDQSPNGVFQDFDGLEVDFSLFIENMPRQCNWKKIPKMLRAIALQEQAFNDVGIKYVGMIGLMKINDQSYLEQAPSCGSPKAFIEGLTNENTPQ